MREISFGKDQWKREEFVLAYPFRLADTCACGYIQEADCVAGGRNDAHSEGYDNFSLLTRESYGPGTRAETRSMFEGRGCTEIIFVPELESCPDGETRYGACFEIVIYNKGVNVWRHYRDDGRCHWHKRLGLEFPVAEGEAHTLRAEVQNKYLIFELDGRRTVLRVEDFPEKFHLGVSCCEGVARIFDMKIETGVPSVVPEEGGFE